MGQPCALKDFFHPGFIAGGDKIAISFLRNGVVETRLSYAALDRDSDRAAHRLLSMGVEHGDPVLLCLPKSIAFVVCHFGLQKIGAISVPVNPQFLKGELQYLVEQTQPRAIVAGKLQAVIIRSIDPRLSIWEIDTDLAYQDLGLEQWPPTPPTAAMVAGKDPAVILYTSGTTGKPKGAVLTNANMLHDAQNIMAIWRITQADTICHALPLFHTHGLSFALHTLLGSGGHVVMLDRFDAAGVLQVLAAKEQNLKCSVFMAVPAMYVKLIETMGETALAFDHLRLLASGSAPLLPNDFERIQKTFGRRPVEREGMTETGMNFSNPLEGLKKPGSIGQALPGLQVRIVDPDTLQDVTPPQAGELWLKGPGISPGYWRNRRETAKAFHDGWFRTGDIGKVDADGYYFLVDRLKDIIISGGENIAPKEVETVINRIEAVQESAVVGLPDEKWGEKVVAAVRLHAGKSLQAEKIIGYCRENLHPWKVPKDVRIVDQIPKNRMGKVLRPEIKALFSD
jgi:malonyl-CoA/methylmalonyl-CoA synthetase